ncbi:MAG: ATP-binding protein [Gammaproteobacteria bacterium]|nr:ATP-binding protein [Gammaproteobacteria bacterium]MBU1722433.1 ATP-binding protein [Gammaproteobacteria bacterium]MBU2004630.1 ATP-binding protein [Gammaproteobacteria bacterium]
MKKLPIGISTLKDILDGGYAYVDKTPHVLKLANSGKYFFLSRPRRFGKSLLLNTLSEVFAGNEALFRGLHIHPHWDWAVKFPVIHISFGGGVLRNRAELDRRIQTILKDNQRNLQIHCDDTEDTSYCFADLIRKAKEQYGQGAVVLVDEYDKPILDNITDPETAAEMRNGLRNFYSVIKNSDEHMRFAFLTGVSKFSKVSVFSGLNNLKDITLDPAFSSVCGYTQTELEHTFAEHLQGVDLVEVKDWYNGYQWLGEGVYNPFDILLFLDTGKIFRPYWFETGTPSFLVSLLKSGRHHVPDLENLEVSSTQLSDFDIDHILLETLLFQTGYLTIKSEVTLFEETVFLLNYPNREVRSTFNQMVLGRYLLERPPERLPVMRALLANDFEALQQRFTALFAGIANDNYRKNPIAEYEGYYAAVMYAYLCSLGIDAIAEDTSSRGRIDLTLRFKLPGGQKQVYIFEFKVIEGELGDGSALRQLQDKRYAEKYDDGENRIFLVGMEFSKATRNIVGFDWQAFSVG